MSLNVGTRLGVYEITTALGAGGMGEVYRARDTKLGRDVALKVVAESFMHDAQRVARFHREAQLLAALNHPHIATIHGLEEINGTSLLVMELVKGETLAERLKAGPLTVREALAIARQVSDALQAAHEKGIIHRDLKPANIAFTAEGEAKVLDFGLAKALDLASGNDMTVSPTLSMAATQAGVILGTAAYMAPEQARGKPTDKRTDIWAFGCVLYEMLTGKRAFEGEDASETMAFVMVREPDFGVLPAEVPPTIRSLVARCLEKDPRKRLADISTAMFVLDDVAGRVGREGAEFAGSAYENRVEAQAQIDAVVSTARRDTMRLMRRRVALVSAIAAIVVGVVAAAATWYLTRPAPMRVERFAIAGSGPTALTAGADRSLTVTPDGARIVYTGNGGRQLLVRMLDQLEPTMIALGALRGPFVSPDGQSVGFIDNFFGLKRVAITGGPAVTVAQMDGVSRGATWLPDDTIVFATNNIDTGLQRVAAGGGNVTVLTRADRTRGEADHEWPEVLPGGRAVLFTITVATGGLDAAQIAVLDLNTGIQKTLIHGGSHAQYVPTGHLVYVAGTTLRAVAFDLGGLDTSGPPIPVLPRILATNQGSGNYAFAADGTLVYADGPSIGNVPRTLVWVDRQGRELPLGAPPRAYDDISVSPDGRQVVAQISGEQGGGVWIYEMQRGTLTRRTFDPAITMPGWSADGTRIVFAAQTNSREARGLYSIPVDGSATQEPLITSDAPTLVPGASSASPDGSTLAFENRSGTNGDIWVVSLRGERKPRPFFETPFNESAPRFSPNGRWLAYQSNESGRNEVYVQPFPALGGKWQISTEGGTEPIWSRGGRELFYRNSDKMMAVDIETTPTFRVGTPRMLFEQAGYSNTTRQYDVAPDGQRFLMLKLQGDAAGTLPQIIVVKNWFEELKRLVPKN